MEHSYTILDNILILTLKGDLIGENNGPELVNLVNDQLHDNVTRCAVDLSEVRYMNSSGIGLLVTLLIRANRQGQSLLAIGLNEHYRHIFELNRLDEAIRIFENESDAMAAAEG